MDGHWLVKGRMGGEEDVPLPTQQLGSGSTPWLAISPN